MGLFDIFGGLKRVMTGEVMQRIDTSVGGGAATLSLRLKKDSSNEHYIVLATISSGEHQYFPFSKEEFAQFSDAVLHLRNSLTQGGAEPKKGLG
jgi:hypothetical protein